MPAQKNNFIKILAVVTLCIFVFFVYLLNFEGPALGYWDTYITVPALFMAGQHVNFISKDGDTLYSYELSGKLPQDLIDYKTYGISPKDQRLGGAIIFEPWFVFFNMLGFRLLFAASGLLIAAFAFLTVRLVCRNFYVSIFTASVAALNSYITSINNLNPNLTGMMLITILLYLLMRKEQNGLIIGLLYGVLGGIRNEAILFLPAIIYRLLSSPEKNNKKTAFFFLGAFITIAPILYWNYYAFGNPFMHPTQSPRLEGFRPVFEHNFLFWKFNFNGMLNFPFHDKVIRTPYFAFPTFLLLPLTLISSLGIIIFHFMFRGTVNLFKDQRRLFIFLAIWFLPMYLLLSAQENWSNMKMTFLLMCINPLIIFMGVGIDEFNSAKIHAKYFLKTVCFCAILFISVKLLYRLNFEVDERWYARFPRAVEGADISYIGDDLRTKKEDAEELIKQKKNLTRANLFPILFEFKIDLPSKLGTIKAEASQKDITVVDFWKYIYEK